MAGAQGERRRKSPPSSGSERGLLFFRRRLSREIQRRRPVRLGRGGEGSGRGPGPAVGLALFLFFAFLCLCRVGLCAWARDMRAGPSARGQPMWGLGLFFFFIS